MSRIQFQRPSSALVVSMVALFVALSGASVAAVAVLAPNTVGSRQVINGSLQKADLSKKTVSALKGKRGAKGARGAVGAKGAVGSAGAAGPAGATGATGPFPDGTLPSGKTLRGTWMAAGYASGVGQHAFDAVSYGGYTLASAPSAHLMATGATPTASCPGTLANPQAAAGQLCVYNSTNDDLNPSGTLICDPTNNSCGAGGSKYGFAVEVTTAFAADYYGWGTWAMTAP